jgi:hypothetical protein
MRPSLGLVSDTVPTEIQAHLLIRTYTAYHCQNDGGDRSTLATFRELTLHYPRVDGLSESRRQLAYRTSNQQDLE